MSQLLDTPVDTTRAELAAIAVPTLVISGVDDEPVAARDLAATLQSAEVVEVPGDHVGASGTPELGAALTDFLTR